MRTELSSFWLFRLFLKILTGLQFLTSSGRMFHLLDNNGIVQSGIDYNLDDLIESTEQVYTKSNSGGGTEPFKILQTKHRLENSLKFSKLSWLHFSTILQRWKHFFFGPFFNFYFLNLSCSGALACSMKGLVVPEQICSAKRESDLLLLLQSVLKFIGKATGRYKVWEWIGREWRERLGNTKGRGKHGKQQHDNNSNNNCNNSRI